LIGLSVALCQQDTTSPVTPKAKLKLLFLVRREKGTYIETIRKHKMAYAGDPTQVTRAAILTPFRTRVCGKTVQYCRDFQLLSLLPNSYLIV